MSIESVLALVAEERREIDRTVRIDWPAERWLAALGERVGAVCQAVIRGGHDGDLRACLVGVAAVCGAWAEADGTDPRAFPDVIASMAPDYVPDVVAHWGVWLNPFVQLLGEVACAESRVRLESGLCAMAAAAVAWAASLNP